jgi:hypothetical protein
MAGWDMPVFLTISSLVMFFSWMAPSALALVTSGSSSSTEAATSLTVTL